MITAYIGTEYIDLTNDFSFEWVRQSQLLSFDKLRGDGVPSISFPDTEHNRAILNHPNRFELQRSGLKEYPNFELRSDGMLLIRGTLVINSEFSGFVRGAVGNLSALNSDLLISKYNLGTAAFQNKSSYNPSTDLYACPGMINPNFFKDISLSNEYRLTNGQVYEETILQHYHRSTAYSVNFRSAGLILIPTDDLWVDSYRAGKITNVISPMFYIFNAITALLSQNGFYITSNQLASNEELIRLCLYNNYNIVQYGIAEKYLDTSPRRSERPNLLDIAFAKYSQSVSYVDFAKLLPPVSLKQFLVGIQNLLNIAFLFSDDNSVQIVDRESIVSGSARDIDQYFTESWILGEKKDVVLEFKMVHDDNDEMFSEGYQDLTDRADDFGDDVATTTDLEAISNPTVGELRRVLSENRIYEYTVETVTDIFIMQTERVSWKPVSIDFQPVKYNEEAGISKDVETIETAFSTVANRANGYVRQVGRLNLRKNSEAQFSPRLIFDSGKNNSANYYLGFNGTNNLLEKRWPLFARFWANRQPVEGYFMFPASIISTFNINEKHSTRHGEFLIEKMTTRVTHRGIGETKIEGYKV